MRPLREPKFNFPCKAFMLLGILIGLFSAYIFTEISFVVKHAKAYQIFKSHPEIVSSLQINEPTFEVKK